MGSGNLQKTVYTTVVIPCYRNPNNLSFRYLYLTQEFATLLSPQAHRKILFGLFFLSGACGLVYEIIWTRMLTLIFGVTVYAVSAVLCAFMLGLALGSLIFGRLADRTARPLRVYGLMEIGIAALALLFPRLLDAAAPLFLQIYKHFYASYHVFSIMRFLAVLPLLLGPTILMGGTLPILSRHFVRRHKNFAHELGLLYAINTAGAVAGVFIVGFVLLAALGIERSIVATAALNVTVGALALVLDFTGKKQPAAEAEADEAAEIAAPAAPQAADPYAVSRGQALMAMFAIALSGFASLGLEVLWTRVLVFHTHNSTYAFSAMLMVFLSGLAVGGWLLGRLSGRIRRPLFVFGLLEAGIGLWAVVSMLLNEYMIQINEFLTNVIPLAEWNKAIALILIKSAIILLAPTILMGMTFPLATRMVTAHLGELGRKVGLVYAANTLGTVAGSFIVGFFLIPLLGMRNSFIAVAVLNIAIAIGLFLMARPMGRPQRWCAALSAAALLLGLLCIVPRDVMKRVYSELLGRVVYYKEEVTDTIMVIDFPDASGRPNKDLRWLTFSDGRGTAGHQTRQENHYCAHLPMLLHEGDPRRVLVICIGSGNIIGAFRQYKCLESIDCVDLSTGIPDAARYFESNDGVFNPPVDPRIKFHAEDGRTFLLGSQKNFDVIQLEPPEMHTAGVVFLFTSDFYEICRKKLNPGGIVLQWINTWKLTDEETRICIASFQKVFPHGTIWQTPALGHMLFVGTEEPLRIPLKRIEKFLAREPGVYKQLVSDNMQDLQTFFSLLLMNETTMKEYCANTPVSTDDKTIIDYANPKAIFSGFGVMHMFSPIRWQHYNMADFFKGGWAYIARLTDHTDTVTPLIDWTGVSAAEKQATEKRIDQRIRERKLLAHSFETGVLPYASQLMTEHWLGSLYQPSKNPRLVYQLLPKLAGSYENAPLYLNNKGLRGGDIIEAKPDKTLRVLALGDSLTFGVGVEWWQAWSNVAQDALNAVTSPTRHVEVINMGVPGYNAVQKAEFFSQLGLKLNPDAVILQPDPQDLSLAPFLAQTNYRHMRDVNNPLIFDLFTVDIHGGHSLRWSDYDPKGMPTRPEHVPEKYRELVGMDRMTEAYTRLAKACAERKLPLLALLPPLRDRAGLDSEAAWRPVRELCARLNIPVIDAGQAMQRYAEAGGLKPEALALEPGINSHPTAAQHALIAQAALPELARRLLGEQVDPARLAAGTEHINQALKRALDAATKRTRDIAGK